MAMAIESNLSTTQYYGARLIKNQIRVLRLLPGRYGDPMCTELTVRTLTDDQGYGQYEALSYTWGGSSQQRTISVDAIGGFRVTDNAYNAMQRLRRHREARVIWIDAVCINQEDVMERNIQVAMMGTIYSLADQVVIWLGDADEAAVRMAHRVSSFLHLDDWAKVLPFLEFDNWFSDFEEHCLVLALCTTKPRWWDRVWVVQEFAQATKPPIICFGRCAIPWNLVRAKAKMFFVLDRHHEQDGWPIVSRGITSLLRDGIAGVFHSLGAFLEVKHSDQTRAVFEEALFDLDSRLDAFDTYRQDIGNVSLADIAWSLRDLQSTDPRDKVFGMLSMIHPETEKMLQPDYELATADIFALATFAALREADTRDVHAWELVTFGSDRPPTPPWKPNGIQPRTAGLPSWAVDFAFPGSFAEGNDTWCRYEPGNRPARFKAGSALQLSNDYKRLTVRCRILTSILQVVPLARQGEYLDDYRQVEDLLANPIPTDPYAVLMSKPSGHIQQTGDDVLIDRSTGFADERVITNTKALAKAFELWHSQIWPEKAAAPSFQHFVPYERGPDNMGGVMSKQEVPDWVKTSCNPRNYSAVIDKFDSYTRFTAGGTTMFRTAQGFLGCANRYVHSGDVIAMLGEASRFVMLRPRQDVFEFLGFAYVHGFMRGELEELKALGYEWKMLPTEITLV